MSDARADTTRAPPGARWRSWLVWALDRESPRVCELLPPDLDRLEASVRIGGTQSFDFDASRPGVRRTLYQVGARAEKTWRWQRADGAKWRGGTSMIVGGFTRDSALAAFKAHLSKTYGGSPP